MPEWLLLLAAGLLGGAMNALAGGGSFATFPALVAAGVPSVAANATSTVALFPGGAASTWVYRSSLGAVCGVPLRPVLLVTVLGGLLGAVLLLVTPSDIFDRVVPWLLLAAAVAIAFGPRLGPLLRARLRIGPALVLPLQFVLGVYGGYFGGAVGLMMLALWALLDGAEIRALQAPRTVLTTAANSIAVLCFIVAGAVRWPEALAVGLGALAGGVLGSYAGKGLPAGVVRAATVTLAFAVTAAFFVRAYGDAFGLSF